MTMTYDLDALALATGDAPNAANAQRQYHVTRRPDGASAVSAPYLAMSGQWLARAGFPLGTRVVVTIEHGKLVLTAAEPAQEPVAVPCDRSCARRRSDAALPARNRR
jgi:hypothetical protein